MQVSDCPRGGGSQSSSRPASLSAGPLVGRWARGALEKLLSATGPASRVLLTGEAGTGKLHLARALHFGRRSGAPTPLEIVRCDGSPEGALLEDLFGREGRSPGRRGGLYWPGAFERARGGTVILARLDAATPPVVVRLRAVLAEGRLMPVDGDDRSAPEFGLVATARDPGASAVRALSSLFDSSSSVPPLAERRGDIEDLFWHFARASGFEGFPAAAATHFAGLPWPGNVPELRAAVGREIARWLAECSSPGMDRSAVESAVRSSWSPPAETQPDKEPKEPKKLKKRPKKQSKKDRILELAARVSSGEITSEDAARLSGATVSYTKRVLRKGS